VVKSIDAVQLPAELVDKLCELNLKLGSIAAAKRCAVDHRIHDFQYILVAKSGEPEVSCELQNASLKAELGLRVLCLLCDTESSIVDVRLRTPLKCWAQKTGSVVRIIGVFEHTLADLRWGDVFIFQRNSSEYVVELSRQLQKSGKKVVFEIDDLLLDLPPFLAHHADAIEQTKPSIIELMKLADALSVSTDNLAEKLSVYSKNVCVTPNYAEPTVAIAKHHDVSCADVKLVVASSDKVLVDMIVEPLKSIQKEYGCQVIAIGPPGHFLAESGIAIQQVENMSHLDFKNFLAFLDNAIGIIPLDNSSFSSCKSAVKYFDYSMAGLPSICSNVLPYRSVITDGENGFLVDNTSDAWDGALVRLVKSAQLRESISREAKLHVERNHNLDISANAWFLLFDSLAVDIASARSEAMKNKLGNSSLSRMIKQAIFHAVRPASYKTALKTFRRVGLKGVYRKLRYG
jgi:glycosyltransferase involved in cell wall biosynthesis